MQSKIKVLVAGVGGASLGTELVKSLQLAGRYSISVCDISSTAFGLFLDGIESSHVVDRENYVSSIISLCAAQGIAWIVPGGEQPMVLLSAAEGELGDSGISLVANSPDVIRTCSDKARTFDVLRSLNIPIPRTIELREAGDARAVGLPSIVKPATGSGGSAMVFFAVDHDEVEIYASYIRRSGGAPIAQEYLPDTEGEFTIGVLSFPDGTLYSSIALRRTFDSKLSVALRGRGGLISSGYSQGYIGDFPELRHQAETIAASIGSRGPINVQGRVQGGKLIPFEINPRLSASCYLRAMAGFNEVDVYLRTMALGERLAQPSIRQGWYLRSLTERYVPTDLVTS